mmetsp:Transcript_41173/g.122947  ORF Transcript_41173/g.122947 Transcript_41173/m.122947 type:complete len:322 (-) Transcript_41173:473-1438(-)
MPMSMSDGEPFNLETSPWVEKISERPRAFYFHNFLADHERRHLIEVAAPSMRRSKVAGPGGKDVVYDVRTSYGTFLRRLHDPVIAGIERRIAVWTHTPLEHQEDVQVLRYTQGQQYQAHYDSMYDDNAGGGPHNRIATFLMYLSNVTEGGETAFTRSDAEWLDNDLKVAADAAGPSLCARNHIGIKPRANDALLFYSYFPNGTMDPASLHTGCPVIAGIKWAAPVWIHGDEFRPQELPKRPNAFGPPASYHDPHTCVDESEDCARFAENGECEHSPEVMEVSQRERDRLCGGVSVRKGGEGAVFVCMCCGFKPRRAFIRKA